MVSEEEKDMLLREHTPHLAPDYLQKNKAISRDLFKRAL